MRPSLKSLVTNRTEAVYDYDFIKALQKLPWEEWFKENRPLYCQEEYLEFFPEWIKSSKNNRILGLDKFQFTALINGTTQCFDEAYLKYHSKRLRLFKGEYAYHKRIVTNFVFIEDETIKENDWIIVSAPFCSLGDIHPEFLNILDQAKKVNAPVLVDCAYFGTCHNIEIDLSHPAITYACFSLSKGIGLGDIRSGIRFSHTQDSLPIDQQNKFKHNVLLNAKVGLYMMKLFGPDHIPNKYFQHQKSVCEELGIRASSCMHIALGEPSMWPGEYFIDGQYCRIGLKHAIKARSQGKI